MPRYFIDTSDQRFFRRDETGQDLTDDQTAKQVAVSTLPHMANDALPDGDARTFLAIVRDENGKMLLQASLALQVTRLRPDHE